MKPQRRWLTKLWIKSVKRQIPGCAVKGKDIECAFIGENECVFSDGNAKILPISLSEGEGIESSACAGNKVFIRTNKNVFALASEGISWYGPVFDISAAHKTGIVAWAVSSDACYILTKDGKVAPIYVEDTGKNQGRTIYTIPSPVDGAKMIEFGGVVFIAFDDKILAFRFNKKDSMSLLIAPYQGAGFSIKGNRLYYGKEGRKITEIKVEKEEITYPFDLGR